MEQDTKLLFDVLLRCRYTLEGVKVILRSGHKKLYPSAVLVLSAEEEVIIVFLLFLGDCMPY